MKGYSAEQVCAALVALNRVSESGNSSELTTVTRTYTGVVAVPAGSTSSFHCQFSYESITTRGRGGEVLSQTSGTGAMEGAINVACPGHNDASCGVSNPTLPGLGVKVERSADYTGAGADPLNFVRQYRSMVMGLPKGSATIERWRHTYASRLDILLDGSAGDQYGHVFARRADGEVWTFAKSAPGIWQSIGQAGHTLTERRDGATNTLLGYTLLVFGDDSTESYDTAGRLLTIKARNGWVTNLSYNTAGQLASVRNAFGRELRFSYDVAGRLSELLPPGAVAGSGAGSATSPIRYAYDETDSLAPGVPAESQLTSVTWQDGSVRRYHYEDSRWPQALTGITDEAAVRYGTYAYDPQGRVTRTEHAGGADRVDFAYDGNPGEPARTIVTDYSGANGSATQRTYTFADIGNTRYPSSVSAPCPLCGSTQQASSYNANGQPTQQIAHDGSVTFYKYDAKGRETERATYPSSYQSATTRPALSAATKVISTKWHATWRLPTQTAEPNKTTANTYNSKGMLTGTSWTATTDATGAAKFAAVKTGSTYATGWSYSASSLATTIVTKETAAGATAAVETGRRTAKYTATGDVTQFDNVTQRQTAKATAFDAHGNTTRMTDESGAALTLSYDARNRLKSYVRSPGRSVSYDYTPWGDIQRTTANDGTQTNYEYNAVHQVTSISESGTQLYPAPAATSALLDVCRTVVNLRVVIIQQCWIAPPIPPRPNDLLPKEERQYDRYCKGSIDPCGALKAATMAAINDARTKMENMLSDPSRLFQLAFFEPNPAATGTNTTWSGHADDLHGKISSIWAMISLGRKLGCDMSAETAAALTLFVPGAPR